MGHRTDPHRIEQPVRQRDRRRQMAEREDAVDIIRLIRSIQKGQNQTDCFCSGIVDCNKLHCPWRKYCLD